MPIYRTQFERLNFDFDPCLKQIADVVFESKVPNDEAHYGELHNEAWDAMWKQNPHWNDYTAPIEGYSGWSSVMGGHKFEEVVDINLDFNLGEPGKGKPRIAELFTTEGKGEQRYRVTSFYKTYTPEKLEYTFTDKLLDKIKADELAEMTEQQREREAKKIRIISCSREDAEFVGGVNVGSCIKRLEDVDVVGIVGWEIRTIARQRRDYAKRDYASRDERPIRILKYWEL